MPDIYLDNSATTRVDDDIAAVALRMMTEAYGNPSSLHYLGALAYQALGVARNQVAQVLGAPTDRIFFTSGGTEGNNLAIIGAVTGESACGQKIITTAIEHSSVLEACAYLERSGYHVVRVCSGPRGIIEAEDIIEAVDDQTALVSVMTVNNETGEVLPLDKIIKGVRQKNPRTLIHTDCVQGFGKIPFKLWQYDVDILTLSSHKIHGPKGAGALFVKEGVKLNPRQFGGSQESGLRPGTENVPLACALGAASYKTLLHLKKNETMVRRLRDYLIKELSDCQRIAVNSPSHSSPYILNLSILGMDTDDMVSRLSMKRIFVSGGAACAKGVKSHVLSGMGLPEASVSSALRISFCPHNTEEELDRLIEALHDFSKT